jgi:polysaccharide export outer membrane protein
VYRQLACLALIGASAACSGPGRYIWYSELTPAMVAASNEYFINTGDTLSVRVMGHDDLSTKVKVRSDGRIALPMLGEIVATHRAPSALRTEIETRLKDYIVQPTVTLNVDEAPPAKVLVLGEVSHPGVIPVDPSLSLAEALALSGGVTEYASRDRIFVVRTTPQTVRIRFTWNAVTRDDPAHAGTFPLHGGDLIFVE